MSGGHDQKSNESRVLNANERADLFNSQLGLFSSALGNQQVAPRSYATGGGMQTGGGQLKNNGEGGWASKVAGGDTAVAGENLGRADAYNSQFAFNAPKYDSQQYVGSGDMRTLTGGDYDKLEQSLVTGASAPLQRMEQVQREGVDQSAADRGIWSSGLAIEAQNDVTERLAPQYAAIGANATAQRYGMQTAEQQALNQFAIDDAAKRNAFNQSQASQNYASDWAPLQYLQQLYAQTGGNVSASNDFGMNFGVALGSS